MIGYVPGQGLDVINLSNTPALVPTLAAKGASEFSSNHHSDVVPRNARMFEVQTLKPYVRRRWRGLSQNHSNCSTIAYPHWDEALRRPLPLSYLLCST